MIQKKLAKVANVFLYLFAEKEFLNAFQPLLPSQALVSGAT